MQGGRKYESFPSHVPKNKFLLDIHPRPLVQLKKSTLQLENAAAEDLFQKSK